MREAVATFPLERGCIPLATWARKPTQEQLLRGLRQRWALVELVLESALRLFGASGCCIGLIDESGAQLVFPIMVGPARTEAFHIPLDQSLPGRVVRTGCGVICNDTRRLSDFFPRIQAATSVDTHSVLCSPLLCSGRPVGVIETLDTSRCSGFDERDLELLRCFGCLITSALVGKLVDHGEQSSFEIIEGHGIIPCRSSAMGDVLRIVRRVAPTNATVLLTGETGTGKEVFARAIHRWGARAKKPFVAVNCAAFSPLLLESELFGHEKGAFTGAIARHIGKFELANSGTLFLDEIGDLAYDLQTKLLRVLQEREFQRVGGNQNIRIEVRILASTNQNLHEAMRSGTFRNDLYYRLSVVSIMLPPLRRRTKDIPVLARHFLDHACVRLRRAPLELDAEILDWLQGYQWPGNIRELENAMQRAALLAAGSRVTLDDLPREIRLASAQRGCGSGDEDQEPCLREAIDALKRDRIRCALAETKGNQSRAARRLGLKQPNLSRMMKSLGLR